MMDVWKQFLTGQQAQWDNHFCTSFGNYFTEVNAKANPNCLSDTHHMGLLKVTGPNARGFLQGQLSCDMDHVSPQQGQLAVHCNPQGRVIATLMVYERDQDYFLVIPQATLAAAMTSLTKYGLFSKVTLTDVSHHEAHVRIGFWGTRAHQALKKQCEGLPEAQYGVFNGDKYTLMRLPSDKERYLIIGQQKWMETLWHKLSKQASPVSTTAWMLEDIRSGIAHIPLHYTETFTPNVLNFHLINGVSFTKGCYTGQEIIARIHYLGKPKQRLFRICVEGAMKHNEDMMMIYSDDTPVGNVLQLCEIQKDIYEGLAVLYVKAAKSGDLVIEEYVDAKVKLLTLPYDKKNN